MLLRTRMKQDSLFPILTIAQTCIKNPNLESSIMQKTLLLEITRLVGIAEKFGGRLLDDEEYLLLAENEESGALVKIIFETYEDMERFINEVKR